MGQILTVALGERSYPIHIGDGLLERTELWAQRLPQRRVALITDEIVAPIYSGRVARALSAVDIGVVQITVPAGEQHKDWETLNSVFDTLLANRCERKTALVALGGGVIGDLT